MISFSYNSYGLTIEFNENIKITAFQSIDKRLYIYHEKVIDPFLLMVNFVAFTLASMIPQISLVSFRAGQGQVDLPLFEMFKLFVLTSVFLVPYHLSKL